MEGFSFLLVGLLGIVFGSFLNMLIYRLPLEISLVNPKRSICPKCDYQIKWFENIPLFSYVILKGKCSNCKEKISFIYPLVELITAFLTIMIFLKVGFGYEFFFITVLTYLFIVLSFIDFKFKAVPNYLLVLSLFITLIYILLFNIQNIKMLFLFAGAIVILEIFVTFYIQNIKAKLLKDDSLKQQKSLGEGDIPIVAIIGGVLGLKLGLAAIFLSAILAIIPAIFNMMVKKDKQTPFIPFLALGFILVFLYDTTVLNLIENIYK